MRITPISYCIPTTEQLVDTLTWFRVEMLSKTVTNTLKMIAVHQSSALARRKRKRILKEDLRMISNGCINPIT